MAWCEWTMALVLVSVAAVGCGGDDGSGDSGGTAADDGTGAGTADDGGDDGSSAADGGSEGGSGSGSGGDLVGGCGSEGWYEIEMPWSQTNYEGVPEGGFAICVPAEWTVTSDASNIILVQRGSDPATTLALGAEFRLDHEDALGRVADNVSAWCSEPDYMRSLVSIDGWPALQQQYSYEEAACGECDEPAPGPAFAVSTYVASGVMLVNLVGRTASPPDPAVVDELVAIGHTLTAQNVGTPGDTAAELLMLEGLTACM